MQFLRAPFSARAWREFAYVLTSLPVAVLLFSTLVTLVATSAGLLVTFVGVPLLAVTLLIARGFGALERTRARLLLDLDVPAPEPIRPAHGRSGLTARTVAVLKSGSSWRHVLYGLVQFPWAVFAFCAGLTVWSCGWGMVTYPLWAWSLPEDGKAQLGENSDGDPIYVDSPLEYAAVCALGVLIVLLLPWWLRALTAVDRQLVGALLGPSRLAERVWALEENRAVVTDTASADLRR
ncbi:sensor domain-containing protein, partial [Streptomyces sp. JJ38]|uniref:sensor domain-containing protein n=1 Tax=Streptomyces sp. JJ38 TaxID=2738128 RepID=UPI001C58FB95